MSRQPCSWRSLSTWLCLFVWAFSTVAQPALAEKVTLADGRVLDGRFVMLSGVAVSSDAGAAQTPGRSTPIIMCDNDLTRTMAPKRLVQKIEPVAPQRWERFTLNQPVADEGIPVASIGPIIEVKPFDAFGHRTFSMATSQGRVDVIQGLTEITPLWCRVESLKTERKPYLWDMRIATTSIPRDVLSRVINRTINPKSANDRLKLVRFYMQGERFQDAEVELQQIIKDFPNLQDLNEQAKGIRKLRDERILTEVEARRKAGQHLLASSMLARFPVDNVAGAVLQEVREKLEEYTKVQKLGEAIVKDMNNLISQVKDKQTKRQLRPWVNEIADNLSIATVDRLAAFHRLADDQTLLPEQRLALAVSGWLLGGNEAVDNVQVALSLAETRTLVHDYLSEPQILKRRAMLEALGSQQGNSPKRVAAILSHMKPPIDTAAQQEGEGFFRLEIRGIETEPDVAYYVQLPPEYDPYVKYPAIVTLHGAATTPEQQLDWWAGEARSAAPRAGAQRLPRCRAMRPRRTRLIRKRSRRQPRRKTGPPRTMLPRRIPAD